MEDRIIFISETDDRFEFCGNVCVKRVLGFCTKKSYICDYYEFSDKEKIKELRQSRMVLQQLKDP